MYIVIKCGRGFYDSTEFKNDLELSKEIDNIAQHASIGNTIIVCDDLNTAARMFQVSLDHLLPCNE